MSINFLNSFEAKYPEEVSYIKENGYGWELLREALVKNKECSKAIELGEFYLKHNNKLAIHYMFTAETYELCNDITSAIKVYERALNGRVKHISRLYKDYAKLSENFYKKDKVIKIYTSFLETNKTTPIYSNFITFLISIDETDHVEMEQEKQALNSKNLILLSKKYFQKGQLLKAKDSIKLAINRNKNNGVAWQQLNRVERELAINLENESNIIRTIEFEPEYHSAGISIIQNFGKLLRDKYTDTPVKISIEQNGLSVKMIIIPPDGKKIEIEEYLSKYGLVLKGSLAPEELLSNPIQVMELKTELKLAQTRIEIQREQMSFIDNQHQSEIGTLKEQVSWLREQVGNGLTLHQSNYTELLQLIKSFNKGNKKTTNNLIKALENKNLQAFEIAVNTLEKEEPEEYNRLKDFIANVGANAPSWIDFASRVFPL